VRPRPPPLVPTRAPAAGTQGAGTITDVTTKERLHKLVDELTELEADDALRYLAERHDDPVIAAFRDAPVDDEPLSAADERALAEVRVDRAAGAARISYAEVMRKHGPA
jgi:hypothetical protein